MLETTSFDDVQIAVYWGSRAIEIVPDPKKTAKKARNARNDEF